MGTNSRATRSGQNSCGDRNTRSTATPGISSPTNHPKLFTSLSTSRPGSAYKKHTAPLRGIGAATTTTTTTTAKRKPPPAARQALPQEEILAEIVVSTNELDQVDVEMADDETPLLGGSGLSDDMARPSTHVSELVLEPAISGHPHASESASQRPPKDSLSADPDAPQLTVEKAPAATSFAKQQIPQPSSIEPAIDEAAIEEHATQLDIDDDTTQVVPFQGENSIDQTSKEETLTGPAWEESISSKSGSVTPASASTEAEISAQQAPQPEIKTDITRSPVDTMPEPTTKDPAIIEPVIVDSVPADFEPHIVQAAMTNKVAEDIFQPEEMLEDSAQDEPSEFDDAMNVGLSYDSPAKRLVAKNMNDANTPNLEFPATLPEISRSVMQREIKLPPGVVPMLNPCPEGPLTAQKTALRTPKEEDGSRTSPAVQPGPTDTDLDDQVSSRGDMGLDLEDKALALKLRRVSDPSIISPLETLPGPISSNIEPSSFGLMSKEDIEQAIEEATRASEKVGGTPLVDVTVGEATIGDGIGSTTTAAPANASRAVGDGSSENNYPDEQTSGARSTTYAAISHQTPAKSTLKQIIGDSRNSFASSSSLSALTDLSGLSSKPPSVSSKATTPFDAGSPREASGYFTPASTFQVRSAAPRLQFNVRPKVSIPADLTPQEYAMECIEAGENSRLNAYALHQDENVMLRSHISHGQVSTYLNIRNGILRLWVRNPQIAVTREEAIGCAKDTRWFDVANVCFDWLVRRGYINYGCVEIRQSKAHDNSIQPRKQRTVVVIGAGFSGLGCARQLEGLFKQYSKRFREMGEEPPRVVVLEGRNRVGGRVYSRAFETLPATAPGVMRGRRFTAEMGGMIITGFERGNPLNILVRGQLGLPYHCLLADMSLHDSNGTNVDLQRDALVEQLYNACLERVSEYKFKTQPAKLIEGNRDLMDEGRDSSAEGHKTIALVEETTAAQPHAPPVSEQNVAPQVDLIPVSTNRMTGKVHTEPGTARSTNAAFKATQIGWTLKPGVDDTRDIDLDPAVNDPISTLGSVLDNALMQHKDILDLNAQDFRLFNWHIANLEYSNATNLNRLSSRGWDVDVGNEWDGRHTMVVGGYQSVARGLATLPAPLAIQHKAAVKCIKYAPDGSPGPARITLEDGKSVEADYVVNTIPLGVLKHGNVEFQPPLPSWKTQAIERLGFGVLNKVILVYKEAFWDKDRDIFGMLQTPTNRSSLNQKDYAARRGRFFQWFSVTNTTGMPCLLALMAGDAAYDTEITPNDELIAEATEVLRMRYGARVTQPLEAIVTRWESDRFARGSYSNAGVRMQPDDYQLMARSLGNLYFAGEHTIVTHPATVHGAYLSGLRAASDVLDAMLGPIDIPTPLVLPRETSASLKRKAQEEHKDPAHARLEAYEMEITEYIHANIGYYPLKPAKVAGNPYILFNKANYEIGRKYCEEGRRAGKGKPSPNEVRTMTSKMWKEASPEIRKPFEEAAEEQKRAFATALRAWTEAAVKWEKEASALRERYMKEHPDVPGAEEASGVNEWNGMRRAKRVVESYREADSDIDMD